MKTLLEKVKFFCLAIFLLFLVPAYGAQYEKLSLFLNGYLAEDLELKNSVLEAQTKALDLKTARINNGLDFNLSTGNLSFSTTTDGTTTVKLTPSFSVSLPELNGSKIEISIPYTSEENNSYVSDGSLCASIGIFSGVGKEAKIAVLEAERAFLEAERKVKQQTLAAEKEFYNKLKTLYNYIISIQDAKNELYKALLNLRVLELQGYSKNSARYRQAFLDSETYNRDFQVKQHLLERETSVFAKKCGLEYSPGQERVEEQIAQQTVEVTYLAVISFLPEEIPFLKEVNISDFSEDKYIPIEEANWNKELAQLKREADRNFSLSAAGEYKFNSTQSGYDDAGGKITLDWRGISASAGSYFPLGSNVLPENSDLASRKNDNPYFQFSLSFVPSKWRLEEIKAQQNELSAQKEEIAVKSAVDEYETKKIESKKTVEDIKWTYKSYGEQYDMYLQLEADMKKWLKEGSVTESDYLDAAINLEKSKFNLLINSIDMIVYNVEIQTLFCTE